MKLKLAALLCAALHLTSPLQGAEPLKVQFISSKAINNQTQSGYEPFGISPDWEHKLIDPLTEVIKGYPITVSCYGKNVEGVFPEGRSEFVTRTRSITPEQGEFPYIRIYRNFLAGQKMITVRVEKLNPGKPYEIRVYCIDFAGLIDSARANSMQVCNTLDDSNPVRVEWGAQTEINRNTDLNQQSALLKIPADDKGAVMFSVRSESKESAILNAFELVEVQ